MSVVNNYSPAVGEDFSTSYGPEPYDLNFVFPLNFAALESERVKLVPYLPRLHAEAYMAEVTAAPELQHYLFFLHTTLGEHLAFVEGYIRRSPGNAAFAVIDKTAPDTTGLSGCDGTFAGVIGFLDASDTNLSLEIGWVVTFPRFQRTYVTSNAIGILMRYCLDPPEKGGLGLRRVLWQANMKNARSIGAAKRMGFLMEGVMRWMRVLPECKEGNGRPVRESDSKKNQPGRDGAVLAISYEEWDNGSREYTQALVDRE